ncbi:MAG TPA: hypothetical protein VM242_13360 [Acidimicrobiales bacterium]|jgi:hypothetical protein|nr:hypothetical protein [Acidimicrobiales bacterium]
MASHVAASAYGHCLAIVRDGEAAAQLAAVAARRGGRTLAGVLGHARHQALAFVARTPPPPVAVGPGAGAAEVAWALAASRPPVELAMVDLAGRYGLGRGGLGHALGLSPTAAAAAVGEAARVWEEELDPALLAWLGPGDCAGLAAVLGDGPRTAAGDLLAVSGAVADHTAECDACGDRRRAAASVRALVAGTPLPEPPPAVVAAAARSRFQPGMPPPPLLPGRGRTATRVLAGVAAAVALAGTVVVVSRSDGSRDSPPSLAALGRVPAMTGALELLPGELDLSAGEVSLLNTSAEDVAWEARADAPWLRVDPPAGRLGARREQVLRLSGSPPEGEVRTVVRVEGHDGSAAAVTLTGTVEHPPDLGASAAGCRVSAVVEDEAEVALTLHARDAAGVESRLPMTLTYMEATADLPAGRPLTWWVSAVDGRGNQARTPDVALPQGC